MTNMVWLGSFKSANKVVSFCCFRLFNQIGQRLCLINPKHSCPPLNNPFMAEFSRLVLLQHFSTVGAEQLTLNCLSVGQTIHFSNILNNITARGDVHIQTRFERISTSGAIHSRCLQQKDNLSEVLLSFILSEIYFHPFPQRFIFIHSSLWVSENTIDLTVRLLLSHSRGSHPLTVFSK